MADLPTWMTPDLAEDVAAALTEWARDRTMAAWRTGAAFDSHRYTEVAQHLQIDAVAARGHRSLQAPASVSTVEAARIKGVSRRTITRWCATGQLPAIRLGRDWAVDERNLL